MFFDKLRAGAQGTVSKVILVLIILSFALAGVGSYVTQPKPEIAAVVNGDEISLQTLENAYRNERVRLENQLGPQFTELLADPLYVEQIRRSVLEQLIDQRLIDQKVAELGIYASDRQVRDAIRALPEFQQDSQFSNERYQQLLARSGINAEQLRDNLRQDLSRQLLLNAVMGSGFTLEAEAATLDKLSRQQRSGEWVRIPLASFTDKIELSDEEINAYYQANTAQFQRPEQVKVNYVLLDATQLANTEIDEAAIEAEYQSNLPAYTQPEQRQVAHIMINKDDDGAAKIEALAERLASGESFSALAKAESDDRFSGENGGELDWMEQGSLDPAFDEAAFALSAKGDISPVVESEFGYHLITLLDKKAAITKPLSEVHDAISAHLSQERAANAFYEQEQRLAELAFEFPDSLDIAAQELGLPVVSTDYFAAEDAPTVLKDTRVLTPAFSADLREQGMNSEVIELGTNKAVVIHVVAHRAAATRDFAEVQDQARAQLLTIETRELAQQASSELAQAWRKGTATEWLAQQQLNKTELSDIGRDSDQDSAIIDALFAMPVPSADTPSVQQVTLSDGNLAVLKLNQVTTPTDSSEFASDIQQGQSVIQGQRELQTLVEALKETASIKYRQLASSNDDF